MVGRSISHYTILEKLGEGGMGVVYKATDTRLGRTVALKFVLSDLGGEDAIHARLTQEARACAALNHPNITTIYDFCEENGRSFIVMEFVEGKTLDSILKDRSFDVSEVIEIGQQVLDALGAAHKKGVVHRDLKPSNIMLDTAGRVKVMDFGLAKLAESSFLTQAGTTLGTAAYMPPEQVRGEDVTSAADIYALGTVLYELATGQPPFQQPYHMAIFYAVLNEDPTPPRELNPAIPEALEHVIRKAMHKEVARRYKSCAEMALDLRQARSELAGEAIAEERPSPAPNREAVEEAKEDAPRFTWRPRVAIPLLAILLVAAFLLVRAPTWLERSRARAHVTNAATLLESGQPRQAHDELHQAVTADPSFSEAWSMLAAVSVQLGLYERAVEQSEEAIALDPRNSFAHYNRAFAQEELGALKEAAAAYEEAIRLDSTFTEAYSALGNLYVNLDRPTEAIQILEKALAKAADPRFLFLIYKALGKAYLAQGDYERALTELQRSLELMPEWPETWLLLAQTYDAAGMANEASAARDRYLQLEPDAEKRQAAAEQKFVVP